MEPSLMREMQAMKQRAMSNAGALAGSGGSSTSKASTDKPKKAVKKSVLKRPSSAVRTSLLPSASLADADADEKPMSIRSYAALPTAFRTKNRFGIQKIVVDHMRSRHKDRQSEALSLDEILREIKYTNVSEDIRQFLLSSLKQNPKIEVKDGDKYAYKPIYKLDTRRSLVEMLKKKDDEGLGAVKMSDILESLPGWDAQRVLSTKQVMSFTRPAPDKETIVFFNSLGLQLNIPEEYQQLWRSVSVEGRSDMDVEDYLRRAGIATVQDQSLRARPSSALARQRKKRRARPVNYLNSHLGEGLLKDYSEDTEDK